MTTRIPTTFRIIIGLNLRSIMIFFFLLLTGFSYCQTSDLIPEKEGYSQSVIHEGIKVEFSLHHVDDTKDPNVFTQNDDVLFRFEITDTLSNKPVTGAAPAAWMEPYLDSENAVAECGQKISSFLTGTLFKRAELDLNVFYVLVMNNDASISVVDPLFSFGGSQLLAYVQLPGVGEDWVVSKNQLHLYVSIPKSEMIAYVNTSNWEVEKSIPTNAGVGSMVLQPDQAYLWAEFNSRRIEGYSGVVAISTETNEVVKTIQTGSGEHFIAVSDDNKSVFVSNKNDGTVSVIDINTLKKVKDIPIQGDIVSMAWSTQAQSVYVVSGDNGIITGIDGVTLEKSVEIQGKTGLSVLEFDPTGQFGFIIGKQDAIVQVLDVASNRIVQNGTTESNPVEVTFSDELAYVTHEDSEIVLMFPIDVIGREGERLQAADFAGGQYPPGKTGNPSKGKVMVQAPGANAMLVSNYYDKTIYYYMEGMAAPMGNFSNYNKHPRAVEVIDRSIEERLPGVYETVGKIRGFGVYDIPFFVDVPRILHCFSVGVQPNPEVVEKQLKDELGTLSIEHMDQSHTIETGTIFNTMFALIDPSTGNPVPDLTDVRVRSISSNNWFDEGTATQTQTKGIYNYSLSFEEPGIYYIYIECKSKELKFSNPQYIILNVVEKRI